ncbi:MAG: hypothetical protein HFF38_12840 [Lawsonibacter sp.]|nr:hypothetical protein [Lawsonibacter sp.]
MLEKFEDNRLNGGKAKTQIIMDALEMYYHALKSDGGSREDETLTVREMEQRLEQFRQEIKEEMTQELFRMIISSMAGQPSVEFPIRKEKQEGPGEDAAADISGMPDIMDKIMDWSES